jgi:hypothetical protein
MSASTGQCLIAAGIALSRLVQNHQPEGRRCGRRASADVLARSLVGRYNADQRIPRSKPAHPLAARWPYVNERATSIASTATQVAG